MQISNFSIRQGLSILCKFQIFQMLNSASSGEIETVITFKLLDGF